MTTELYIESMQPGSAIKPGALGAIASYIEHDYGHTGYVVETLIGYRRSVAMAVVVASDGGRFCVAADEWGNAETLPEKWDEDGRNAITRLYTNAVTA